MRARQGVTLVELMVALTLLGTSLLALAAASATLARHRRAAQDGAVAAGLAAERSARLAACVPVSSGERAAGRLRERWTAGESAGVRVASTTVEHVAAGRRWTFTASALCAGP